MLTNYSDVLINYCGNLIERVSVLSFAIISGKKT